MPTYVFECDVCNVQRDVIASISSRNDQQVCKCGNIMHRVITPAYSMPDIKPYRAIAGDAAGKEIAGRRAHREFLKRNRLIEVGDAPIGDTKQMRHGPKKGEIAAELKRVVPEVLRGRR